MLGVRWNWEGVGIRMHKVRGQWTYRIRTHVSCEDECQTIIASLEGMPLFFLTVRMLTKATSNGSLTPIELRPS